jgi:hypothetical protein
MARIALFENLPIGGKVWLGFSLTTALFMVVIWIYHATLFQSLSDYERLLSVSEARKSHLQHIYQYLLEARRSEKDFLAEKEMASAEDARMWIGARNGSWRRRRSSSGWKRMQVKNRSPREFAT